MSWLARIMLTIFCIWPDRWHKRRDLREMDDEQLRDLGISQREALRESQKPFWR